MRIYPTCLKIWSPGRVRNLGVVGTRELLRLPFSSTLGVAFFVAMTGPLLGVDYIWDGGTPAAGPYTWGTNGNWTVAGFPNSNADTTTFQTAGVTAPYIVEVNGTFMVNVMTFTGANSYTLIPQTLGNGLTFNSAVVGLGSSAINVLSGSHTINVPISLLEVNLFIRPSPGTIIQFNAPITEATDQVDISLNGEGTVIASQLLGNTGVFSVQDCALLLMNEAQLMPSVTLDFLSANNPTFMDISNINGGAGASITVGNLSALEAGSNVALNLGNKNLTFGADVDSTFLGSVFGSGGSLTKKGTGTFTLLKQDGATYSGPTTINEGTFQAGSVNAFAPFSDVVINGTGTLDLGGFNNTIQSLNSNSSTAVVTNSMGGGDTLTISQGGTYYGLVTGDLVLQIFNVLNLYGDNTYTTGTVLENGAIVGVGHDHALGTSSLFMPSASTLRALKSVTLSNDILLIGGGTIDLQNYSMGLAGNITEVGTRSLTITGGPGGILTLSGNNTYTGTTTIASGVTVAAGSATGVPAFSNLIMQGASTLDLLSFSAIVDGLTGHQNSIIKIGLDENLTISTLGGTFAGIIEGAGSLVLFGSTVNLTGVNTYTGDTAIGALTRDATLKLLGSGAISPVGSVILTSTGFDSVFDLSGINEDSRTIGNLGGSVTTGSATVNLGNKNLTFGTASSSIFEGSFIGNGGSLTKQGAGTFTITAANSTYTGPTELYDGVFQGGITDAFCSTSDFVLYNGATLDLNGFNQSIQTLNSTSTSSVVTNAGTPDALLSIANGGTFAGTITESSSTLSLGVNGGTLNLIGNNSYSGLTFVNAGATIGVGSSTALGTGLLLLDSLTTLRSLAPDLSLVNDITLTASPTVDVQSYAMTLSGDITDGSPGSSLIVMGLANGVLTLSGTNTYGTLTGSTTLTGPVRLRAGSAGGFSLNSNFILQGTSTLDLGGFDNTIYTLASTTDTTLITNTGLVDATLTIRNGGSYYGLITDGFTNSTGIQLNNGVLTLLSPNTYSGDTTIISSTLQALANNAFSPNSLVTLTLTGVLDLNGFNNTIAGLQGTSATQVLLGADSTLTISGGLTTTFSGQIINSPCSGITIDGGTILTLNGIGSTYCGTTDIVNGTLSIQGTSSLSSDSPIQVGSLGTLTIGAFTNAAPSLVTSGIVTNSGGDLTLSGALTITAGTVINSGGTLEANQTSVTGGEFFNVGGATFLGTGANPTFSITGGVVSNGTMCTSTSCALPLCLSTTNVMGDTSTAITVTGGLLHTNSPVIGASYAQGPNATLNLTMCSSPSTFGQIRANGAIALDGTLVVTDNSGTFTPTPNGFYSLVLKPNATVSIDSHSGEFSNVQLQGFPASPVPRVITAPPRAILVPTANLSIVTLYFSECIASWNTAGSGNWDNSTNWNPPCVPGISLPTAVPIATNDGAIFPNVAASSVTVTLARADQLSPLVQTAVSPILLTMDFSASTTSYTINAYSGGGSKLIFDATPLFPNPAQITVSAGTHTINAPMLLNIMTDLLVSDGAQMTFGTSTTMLSGSTPAGFFFARGLSSTLDTGRLVNNGNLTPSFFTFESAILQNNQTGSISPTGAFTMAPVAGHTAQLINSGTINPSSLAFQGNGTILVDNSGVDAAIGSSQPNGALALTGPGLITINNSGVGATFGSSGSDGNFLVNSSGTVILNNTGATAEMGPSGAGSQFIVNGTGPIFLNNIGEAATMAASGSGGTFLLDTPTATVINQGLHVVMGATGSQGNLTINAGVVQNRLGAHLTAGASGLLTIAGGSLTNDLTSSIGSLTHNVLFSAGTLVNGGGIYAFDYTQQNGANLTLTLTSVEGHGFIEALNTATLNNAIVTVEALPGFTATSSDVIVLLSGERGYTGSFTTVNFIGFSDTLIPALIYFPTTIDLVFAGSVTPSSNPTAAAFALPSITGFNVLVGREMTILHEEMYRRKRWQIEDKAEDVCLADNGSLLVSRNVLRKEEQLTDAQGEIKDRPWRVYVGPIGSVGELEKVGSQAGLDYTSVGVFGGLDHTGDNLGLGIALDYENIIGDVHNHAGGLKIQQLHGSVYGTGLVKGMPEMAVGVIVGGGKDWYSLSRVAGSSLFPVSAKAHTEGTEWDALLDLEYIFSHQKYEQVPQSLEIIPRFNVQYVGISVDGFKEEKAGLFDLEVENQFRESLRSYLGTRLVHTVDTSFCTLRTEIDLGWQREYMDHGYNLAVSTINFTRNRQFQEHVHGLGRNTFLGGLDLLLTVYKVFQVEASYDLQWNSRLIDNSFYLGIGGKF